MQGMKIATLLFRWRVPYGNHGKKRCFYFWKNRTVDFTDFNYYAQLLIFVIC